MKSIEKIKYYISGELSKKEMREMDKEDRRLDKEQGWKNGKPRKKKKKK